MQLVLTRMGLEASAPAVLAHYETPISTDELPTLNTIPAPEIQLDFDNDSPLIVLNCDDRSLKKTLNHHRKRQRSKRDKEKVANMTDFDDFYWEATGALRLVKTREAFLKNYDKMFTPAIKNKIATAKPKEDEKGYYSFQWHTTNFE